MSTQTTAPAAEARTCQCGCEQSVGRKASYRPGHDARHVSQVARQVADLDPHAADVPAQVQAAFGSLASDALRAKAGRVLDNRHTEALNGFGDAGIEVPWTSNPALGRAMPAAEPREVRVGRWWYPVTGKTAEGLTYGTKDGQTKTAPAGAEVRAK